MQEMLKQSLQKEENYIGKKVRFTKRTEEFQGRNK